MPVKIIDVIQLSVKVRKLLEILLNFFGSNHMIKPVLLVNSASY